MPGTTTGRGTWPDFVNERRRIASIASALSTLHIKYPQYKADYVAELNKKTDPELEGPVFMEGLKAYVQSKLSGQANAKVIQSSFNYMQGDFCNDDGCACPCRTVCHLTRTLPITCLPACTPVHHLPARPLCTCWSSRGCLVVRAVGCFSGSSRACHHDRRVAGALCGLFQLPRHTYG